MRYSFWMLLIDDICLLFWKVYLKQGLYKSNYLKYITEIFHLIKTLGPFYH